MNSETSLTGSHITRQPQAIYLLPPLLPLEILVEIFLLSRPPIHQAQAPHKTALSLVCRFWNTVIDSTPILWSRISIADEIPYVQKSLLRSGKSPIEVYGTNPGSNAPVSHERHLQFLWDVGRHAERWKCVTLQVKPSEEQDPPVTVLPLLESIKLRSRYHARVPDAYLSLLGNAGSHAPRLRKISLHTTLLPRWDILFPPSLSTLTITRIFRSGPSSSELLSILAACPNLVALRLYQVHPPVENGGVNNSTNAAPIVELAALQNLSLKDVSELIARDLLARLRLPNDCAISVRCTISNSSPTTSFLNPALSRYRDTLQHSWKTQQIKIGVTRAGFRLIVVGGRRHIKLNLGRTSAIRDALEWFGINTESGNDMKLHSETLPEGVVTPPNDPSITLAFAENALILLGFNYLTPVLDFRYITKIKTARLRPLQQAAVLSYLSERGTPAQPMPTTASPELTGNGAALERGVNARPFPGLRNLVVNGSKDDALKNVIDCIRSRSGDDTVAGAPGAPARLKRIEFVDESPEAIPHPKEACWDLLTELLDVMDNDAEVCWHGERISKTRTME